MLTVLLFPLLLAAAAPMIPEYAALRRVGDRGGPPTSEEWSVAPEISFGPERYRTSFRARWDETGLWLRFHAADSDPWYTMTERDAPLWEEEVVEIFIDPDGDGRDYVEIEISPANVVTDLMMFRGDPGKRSDIDWDFPGLTTAVEQVERPFAGWLATAFLPWSGFAGVPGAPPGGRPAAGDRWRFNVFRIKRPGGPEAPEDNAVYAAWSPPPGASFHVPAVFGTMTFEERP
jgi:hypothetical protein